jgi:pSer/pThr/pTyr-binding forkhead associated (FHA) protein
MVQLAILSGKQAGSRVVARRFPFCIGRDVEADLRVEEAGVWDRHVELDLRMPDGFVLNVPSEAGATVNGASAKSAVLHGGDLIEIGALKIQFWLSETRQRELRLREALTWFSIAALCAGQLVLIYYLLP